MIKDISELYEELRDAGLELDEGFFNKSPQEKEAEWQAGRKAQTAKKIGKYKSDLAKVQLLAKKKEAAYAQGAEDAATKAVVPQKPSLMSRFKTRLADLRGDKTLSANPSIPFGISQHEKPVSGSELKAGPIKKTNPFQPPAQPIDPDPESLSNLLATRNKTPMAFNPPAPVAQRLKLDEPKGPPPVSKINIPQIPADMMNKTAAAQAASDAAFANARLPGAKAARIAARNQKVNPQPVSQAPAPIAQPAMKNRISLGAAPQKGSLDYIPEPEVNPAVPVIPNKKPFSPLAGADSEIAKPAVKPSSQRQAVAPINVSAPSRTYVEPTKPDYTPEPVKKGPTRQAHRVRPVNGNFSSSSAEPVRSSVLPSIKPDQDTRSFKEKMKEKRKANTQAAIGKIHQTQYNEPKKFKGLIPGFEEHVVRQRTSDSQLREHVCGPDDILRKQLALMERLDYRDVLDELLMGSSLDSDYENGYHRDILIRSKRLK